MRYETIKVKVKIPTQYASKAREMLEVTIDQMIIQDIPVADSEVTQECSDPPELED